MAPTARCDEQRLITHTHTDEFMWRDVCICYRARQGNFLKFPFAFEEKIPLAIVPLPLF